MGLAGWPTVTDGSDPTTGTVFNKALTDSIKASVEGDVTAVTNPTVKAKTIIDEVVAARGSKVSLDARLDVLLNEDGTPKSVTGIPSVADIQSILGGKNLWWDSLFNIWPSGDTSAPSDWVLSGSGAAIVRTGAGPASSETSPPGDTTKTNYGYFAAKMTYGAATAKLTRTLIPTASGVPTGLKGRTITVGIRCRASASDNRSSIVITDGIQSVRGGTGGNGTYATTTAETWLYATITIDSSATKLEIYLEQNSAGNMLFSAGVLLLGNYAVTDWFPERHGWLIIGQQQSGNAVVATTINEFRTPFTEYAYLFDTRLNAKTAPVTTAIITKPSKGVGTFPYATTFPQIAAAATQGNLKPNGVYQNRCFKPDDVLTWDITQIGTGTVGAEVNIVMKFVTYPDEFLLFR